MNIDADIYARQRTLPLHVPYSAAIVGCGGIGSWTGLGLALSGVRQLILVDPDTVEESNLNRTPYRLADVGQPKVLALMRLILERRAVDVIPLCRGVRQEDVVNARIVLDCRDALFPALKHPRLMKLGYNGGDRITVHVNPDYNHVLEDAENEGGSYEIVPSWIAPATLAAVTGIIQACFLEWPKEEIIHSISLASLFLLKGV